MISKNFLIVHRRYCFYANFLTLLKVPMYTLSFLPGVVYETSGWFKNPITQSTFSSLNAFFFLPTSPNSTRTPNGSPCERRSSIVNEAIRTTFYLIFFKDKSCSIKNANQAIFTLLEVFVRKKWLLFVVFYSLIFVLLVSFCLFLRFLYCRIFL